MFSMMRCAPDLNFDARGVLVIFRGSSITDVDFFTFVEVVLPLTGSVI